MSARAADPYRDTDVIDSRAPRFNQAVVGVVSVLAVLTGWWWLLGVLGALVAIPIAATIESILRDIWKFRREDQGDDHEVAVAPTAAEPAS